MVFCVVRCFLVFQFFICRQVNIIRNMVSEPTIQFTAANFSLQAQVRCTNIFLYFVKTNFFRKKRSFPFHANLTQLYGKTLSRLLAADAECAELVETIQYSSKERLRYISNCNNNTYYENTKQNSSYIYNDKQNMFVQLMIKVDLIDIFFILKYTRRFLCMWDHIKFKKFWMAEIKIRFLPTN